MNREIVNFVTTNLKGASLKSFGIRAQFIELEFESDKFEEIEFFIDCEILLDSREAFEAVNLLKKGCDYTYKIGYFVFLNRQTIISSRITVEGNLLLNFSNNLSVTFDLNLIEDSNLSITFREFEGGNYTAVDMNSDNNFEMNLIQAH